MSSFRFENKNESFNYNKKAYISIIEVDFIVIENTQIIVLYVIIASISQNKYFHHLIACKNDGNS